MATFGPPPQLTEDDLIDVLRRNMEDHWIEGLLDDPSSRSVFIGMIDVLLRAQDAIDANLYEGAFILSAPGRAGAESVVRLERPSGSQVTITTNQRFADDRGAIWVPSADYVIPASGTPQSVDVPIITDRAGHWLNSFEVLTYQSLDALPDPNLIVVAGPDPAANGTSPFLEQHGKERRVFRGADETADAYRRRIRYLEDQVSPTVMAETIVEVCDSWPATKSIADLIANHGLRVMQEPFKDSAHYAQRGLYGSQTAYADDVTYADDVNGHVLRDFIDALQWFDVRLPTIVDPNESRLFLDDGFLDDPEFGFFDMPAGEAITSPIATLVDELDRRRMGGVYFRIIFGWDLSLIRHPLLTTLTQVGDWTDQDGNTTDQDMVEAVEFMDGDGQYAVSSTGRGPAAALTVGDLLYTLPAFPTAQSISHVVMRAWVRRVDLGAGTDPDFSFMIKPSTAGAAQRIGTPLTISSSTWQEVSLLLEQNPLTAAAWTLADVASTFGIGVANSAAAGPTEALQVSELTIEFVVSYG